MRVSSAFSTTNLSLSIERKKLISKMIWVEVLVNGKFLFLHEDVYSANDMLPLKLRVDDEVLIKMNRSLSIFRHRRR
jgi:hypothetical protein